MHFILPARILKKKHRKIATRASKSVHDKDHKLQPGDNSKTRELFFLKTFLEQRSDSVEKWFEKK